MMAMTKAPVCPLCGAEMREELGAERRYFGCVERTWTCPSCLHRMTTYDVIPVGGDDRPDEEARQQCISM
jgi:transposase-like protein